MSVLRITGGKFRGRRLMGKGGPDRRPTTERVREAIFSILASRNALEDARVYDLFAGTGALGFEALSRGAAWALFVDHDRRALKAISEDMENLGLTGCAEVEQADLRRGFSSEHHSATLVLLDPPYTQADLLDSAVASRSRRTKCIGAGCVDYHRNCPEVCCGASRSIYCGSRLSLRRHSRYPGEVRSSMTIAIYPGSFDPITNGHVDIIKSGLVAFDKVIVGVLHNPHKAAFFSVDERMKLIREAFSGEERVEVDQFQGLLVDYCREKDVSVVLRGLRAVADFEYELQMANMNRRLNEGVRTVFIMANDDYFYVSSTLVKEVASLGGDISGLVPDPVAAKLYAKLGR